MMNNLTIKIKIVDDNKMFDNVMTFEKVNKAMQHKHIVNSQNLIEKIIFIQKRIRGYIARKKYHTLLLINKLNKNKKIMKECFSKILKVLQLFPPCKNENKFIYGKLIEIILIKYINKIVKCQDLDKNHKIGSEYKNDCEIKKVKYSIKACKNGGNIILINKHSKNKHVIHNMNFIICHIKNEKLYIFNSIIIPNTYIKDSFANISYKSGVFRFIEKKYNENIFIFPKCIEKRYEEINIYEYLYKNFI